MSKGQYKYKHPFHMPRCEDGQGTIPGPLPQRTTSQVSRSLVATPEEVPLTRAFSGEENVSCGRRPRRQETKRRRQPKVPVSSSRISNGRDSSPMMPSNMRDIYPRYLLKTQPTELAQSSSPHMVQAETLAKDAPLVEASNPWSIRRLRPRESKSRIREMISLDLSEDAGRISCEAFNIPSIEVGSVWEDSDMYDVEQVHGERDSPVHAFLIRWVGSKKLFWVPAADCSCEELINEFRMSSLGRDQTVQSSHMDLRDETGQQERQHRQRDRKGRFTRSKKQEDGLVCSQWECMEMSSRSSPFVDAQSQYGDGSSYKNVTSPDEESPCTYVETNGSDEEMSCDSEGLDCTDGEFISTDAEYEFAGDAAEASKPNHTVKEAEIYHCDYADYNLQRHQQEDWIMSKCQCKQCNHIEESTLSKPRAQRNYTSNSNAMARISNPSPSITAGINPDRQSRFKCNNSKSIRSACFAKRSALRPAFNNIEGALTYSQHHYENNHDESQRPRFQYLDVTSNSPHNGHIPPAER